MSKRRTNYTTQKAIGAEAMGVLLTQMLAQRDINSRIYEKWMTIVRQIDGV